MQYVRSISGSVSKTWNSINPATLSGAIDVIVIEQEDGTLACSPFHVRFGKFSLLRPYEKKVEFKVNGVKQDYAMKLGEGGEAFFVFETTDEIPASLQTSPLVSPTGSPQRSEDSLSALPEPDFLDLDKSPSSGPSSLSPAASVVSSYTRAPSDYGSITPLSLPSEQLSHDRSRNGSLGDGCGHEVFDHTNSDNAFLAKAVSASAVSVAEYSTGAYRLDNDRDQGFGMRSTRSRSPPPLSLEDAMSRAISLSKKLSGSNIPSHVTETGDLMLDMTGYKSSEEGALRAEVIARKILADELEGHYDIGALIGADEYGNLWIYSSEEARDAASRRSNPSPVRPEPDVSEDAVSDPGYHSDSDHAATAGGLAGRHHRTQSDLQPSSPTPPRTPPYDAGRSYAKTLRLTSDQLKALNLKLGANSMSFSVNKATCVATMYLWSGNTPIVISDIDGTITKSDALGHVLNMIGRDWTHTGVAKLYTDIAKNGYNIMYLTSRSVGQADTTRSYLYGVCQDGYRLPRGPVIMSPDRTIAALRREVYLRKPEVFKMACLRDILSLFRGKENPFYAGFGNRLTDALSYRSVNIPSTRIFTINSNAEVSLDLLSLNKYRSSYVSMRELLDHFFPPTELLVQAGGESFTDFTYWRDVPRVSDYFSSTDSESDEDEEEEDDDEYDRDLSEAGGSVFDGDAAGEDDAEAGYIEDSQLIESAIGSIPLGSDEGSMSDDSEMRSGGIKFSSFNPPS